MTSQIIPLPFVLLNLGNVKRKKLQKIEYLENEKSFLDQIKNIFHSFWRAIIWWKNKNLISSFQFLNNLKRKQSFSFNESFFFLLKKVSFLCNMNQSFINETQIDKFRLNC